MRTLASGLGPFRQQPRGCENPLGVMWDAQRKKALPLSSGEGLLRDRAPGQSIRTVSAIFVATTSSDG